MERPCGPKGSEFERLPAGECIRPLLAPPRGEHGCPHLREKVERGSGGRAVSSQADPEAGSAKCLEWREAAAEHRIRARAVSNCHIVLGEQGDLLPVDLDAVRGEEVRAKQALAA